MPKSQKGFPLETVQRYPRSNHTTLKCVLFPFSLLRYDKTVSRKEKNEIRTDNKGGRKMKEVVEFLKANPVQYLADAEATIADFSGNPPRTYRF